MNQKFLDGDEVEMTEETLKFNQGARSTTGIVIRGTPDKFGTIRVRRIGLKTIESWAQSAWELSGPKHTKAA